MAWNAKKAAPWLLLALMLPAGCASAPSAGGGTGAGSSDAAKDSGGAPAPAPAGEADAPDAGASGIPESPVKIAVGYTALSHTFGPLFVAKDLGYFEENNLDVELVQLESSAQLTAALTSDSVQVSPGDISAGLTAITKGIDIVFLAADQHAYSQELWGKPGIEAGEGLRGKSIAVSSPGSLTDHAIRDYLTMHGLNPDTDVDLQYLGGTTARAAALEAGQVDVMISTPPQGMRTERSGNALIDDLTGIPRLSSVYMALGSYVDAHPEVIRAFMRGYLKGLVKVKTDYEGTKEIMAEHTQITDEAVNRAAYEFFVDFWEREPRVDPELIRLALKELEDQDAARKVDVEAAIREEFLLEQIENGYLEELYANAP